MKRQRLSDRFVAWFAAFNGSKRLFYGTALFFGLYVLWGQRLPGLPHLPTFDPYPFVFMTFALSLWANLQNIALQYTGQGIDLTADKIRQEQGRILRHIESEEDEELIEIRALTERLHALIAHLEGGPDAA